MENGSRIGQRVAEAVSPVAQLDAVIGQLAYATGLSVAEVRAALEDQVEAGRLITTEGGNVYNPVQPFLPGMSLEQSYR